ncbi:MAG: LysR family transcriptional regulator [Rhodobacteraceae bacterium]|nr:LysR family transcriptional regulator [Paracoccaceae bacterium]
MQQPAIQRRYLPSHSMLRSFECAARHASFTLAAEELHLTQSAISRQVRELEEMVGTDLFRRAGRRVALTEAGMTLAAEISVDLENIHQTIMRAVSAGQQNTSLRVAVLPGFASRWLIPRLPEFAALHPTVELSFATRLKPFNMTREHFDLAVHFGAADCPDTDMIELCNEQLIAVAAPSFVDRYNIDTLDVLATAPLLHLETRPMIWRRFFDQAGVTADVGLSGKYFDQFSMVISATVAGLGAGLIPSYLIEHELASGALVPLSTSTITTRNSYYLVTPRNRENDAVAKLCDWMIAAISEQVL